MANIREYTNPITKLTPNDKGSAAMADLAREQATAGFRSGNVIKDMGNDIGSAISGTRTGIVNFREAFVVRPELSKGAAVAAGLTNQLTTEWNEYASTADVNDHTIGASFAEKRMQPAIDKFKESFETAEGQQWAEKYANGLLEHMNTKIIADSASRAGAAAKKNLETTSNQLSTTALADPSSFDFLIKQADQSALDIVKNTPNLSPASAAALSTSLTQQMKKEIAQAAIMGMAKSDPTAAMKAVQSGKFSEYLNGAEEMKYLKQMEVLKKSEVRAAKLEERERIKDEANKFSNDMVRSVIQPDGSVRIGPEWFTKLHEYAGRLNEADPVLLRTLFEFGQKETLRERSVQASTDPEVFRDLSVGLLDGTTTLEKIVRARTNGQLSTQNFNELYQNYQIVTGKPQAPGLKAALNAAEKTLTVSAIPGIPGRDPKGFQSYSQFINAFLPEYTRLQQSGNLPANALDFNDPKSLINQKMMPYKRLPAQQMQDYISGIGGLSMVPNAAAPTEMKTGEKNMPVVPMTLRGIADLQYSNSRGQFYDGAEKIWYYRDGSKVK